MGLPLDEDETIVVGLPPDEETIVVGLPLDGLLSSSTFLSRIQARKEEYVLAFSAQRVVRLFPNSRSESDIFNNGR